MVSELSLRDLIVDLDGTLVFTDMLHESVLWTLSGCFLDLVLLPSRLARGKAEFKQRLANGKAFDPKVLPYNTPLVDWLKKERESGRRIVLCTGTDRVIAEPIAAYLGLFDEVIASDGVTNLIGARKADLLERRYGHGGFDYVGNTAADLEVWKRAGAAIIANATPSLVAKAHRVATVERVFDRPKRGLSVVIRMLRVHQWVKNVLLAVPLLASHNFASLDLWASLVVAFVAFSLCASSVYITNDLIDLESDRQHPRKRYRPFASGRVPVIWGVALAPLLLVLGLALGALVGLSFLLWLLLYFAITCVYSWRLKKLVIIDCLTLAILYTLRIVAGAEAIGNELSFWLLAFSVFLFLSLAYVKRYAEMEVQLIAGKERIHGRGYRTSDAQIIQTMGIVAGYTAVLVLAFYLNSDAVVRLYKVPQLIWGAVLVMLFWISWIWMQAHRGRMLDDPVVFAIKDRVSLIAGVVLAIVMGVGAVGLPW